MTNPVFMCDFYKLCHADMVPEEVCSTVSYMIPRVSRIHGWDTCVFFGAQAVLDDINRTFEREFFSRPFGEIADEVMRDLAPTVDMPVQPLIKRLRALHSHGKLPIRVHALPEGAEVPMGVPFMSIESTSALLVWVPQFLETWITCSLWHAVVAATVAKRYRELADRAYGRTVVDGDPSKAISLFSMRGEESASGAAMSGAAWSLYFDTCATVAAIPVLRDSYMAPADATVRGMASSEHAVMCAANAVCGDETEAVRRLVTGVAYRDRPLSLVLDSVDYRHAVDVVLPSLETEIRARGAPLYVRGDSGDPVEVVMWTVRTLWAHFGGTVNAKGYRVLDPCIRVVYGDGITLDRAKAIYDGLEKEGYSAENVSLGAGAFSMQAVTVDGVPQPLTRDTFGIATKVTCITTVDRDGHESWTPVRKAPKDDPSKTSPAGYMVVTEGPGGRLTAKDGHGPTAGWLPENLLKPLFAGGVMFFRRGIGEIRATAEGHLRPGKG